MAKSIRNVLADRYASQDVRAIWSEDSRIVLEREFWIAIMKAQRSLGIEIPEKAIRAYEAVMDKVDLASIRKREIASKHDVKARIEEFCHLAGHEHIHMGMTSRDLTDNVEQLQIFRSLLIIRIKYVALLLRLSDRAHQWRDLVVVGRTHHAPAQPTTMGKRIAMFGEEMLRSFERLEHLIESYPLRGLKGAVGTGLDQLTLFDGDAAKLIRLQEEVLRHVGVSRELNAVGQVYPRSLDFETIGCLYQLGGGLANLARTIRLMAGGETATEGFSKGQVGSSAMPHKMNTRNTERINGLQVILGGYLHMIGALVGDQWFEGDVSCSVVRRVALPDSFFAIDGMIETMLHVVDGMGVYEAALRNELDRFMPFLSTTTIMMEAVRRGEGRERVHEAVRDHAIATALAMRTQGAQVNDLTERLSSDDRIPLTKEEIEDVIRRAETLVGLAREQTDNFIASVEKLGETYREAEGVKKGRQL